MHVIACVYNMYVYVYVYLDVYLIDTVYIAMCSSITAGLSQ